MCPLFSSTNVDHNFLCISTLVEIIHKFRGKDTTGNRSKIHHLLKIQEEYI